MVIRKPFYARYLNNLISIVFIWSRNGAIKTKAFVIELLAPELIIVGGAVFTDPSIAYITSVNVM